MQIELQFPCRTNTNTYFVFHLVWILFNLECWEKRCESARWTISRYRGVCSSIQNSNSLSIFMARLLLLGNILYFSTNSCMGEWAPPKGAPRSWAGYNSWGHIHNSNYFWPTYFHLTTNTTTQMLIEGLDVLLEGVNIRYVHLRDYHETTASKLKEPFANAIEYVRTGAIDQPGDGHWSWIWIVIIFIVIEQNCNFWSSSETFCLRTLAVPYPKTNPNQCMATTDPDTLYETVFVTSQRHNQLQFTNPIRSNSFGALYRIG